MVGVRTGDKGRGLAGEPLANFEPGNDIVAAVTVLAEGTQGHLTGVALDHFGLRPQSPQVWELGVKEVWRVAKPLDRVIHTMGWPLRTGARYREFGGIVYLPHGGRSPGDRDGGGSGLPGRQLSVHDLLQEFKTHPKIRPILEGGERLEWGAKTIPGGGLHSLPARLHAPGVLLCGDGAGMVNIPTLKGIHYAIESGRLAAEAVFRSIRDSTRPGSSRMTRRSCRASSPGTCMRSGICARCSGGDFFVGGALASVMTVSKGRVSVGRIGSEPDADQPVLRTDRAAQYPAAGRQAHLRQAVVGVRVREQDPRRPTQPHPPDRPGPGRHRRDVGPHVPGPGVRGRPRRARRAGHRRSIGIQLRAVRRHLGQRRPADSARRGIGPRIHPHLGRSTPWLV